MGRRAIDLAGQTFGALTVIERAGSNERKDAMWRVHCDRCGKNSIMAASMIKRAKDCGCMWQDKINGLEGHKFGALTIIERAGSNEYGNAMWRVHCDRCGKDSIMAAKHIKSASDCGCRFRERIADLSGCTMGALNVIERVGVDKHGNALYMCKCNVCGREKIIPACTIRSLPKSCGCQLNVNIEACRQGGAKGGRRRAASPEAMEKWRKAMEPLREQRAEHFEKIRLEQVHVQGTNLPVVRMQRPSRNNSSGYRGVFVNRRRGQIRYKGRVQIRYEVRYTPEFELPEEAKATRDELQRRMIAEHCLTDLIWPEKSTDNK